MLNVWRQCQCVKERSWALMRLQNHPSHILLFKLDLISHALVKTTGIVTRSLRASLRQVSLSDLEKLHQGTLPSVKGPVTYFPPLNAWGSQRRGQPSLQKDLSGWVISLCRKTTLGCYRDGKGGWGVTKHHKDPSVSALKIFYHDGSKGHFSSK